MMLVVVMDIVLVLVIEVMVVAVSSVVVEVDRVIMLVTSAGNGDCGRWCADGRVGEKQWC